MHFGVAKTLDGNVASLTALSLSKFPSEKKISFTGFFLLLTELHVTSFPMEMKEMKTAVVCDLLTMYLVFLTHMVTSSTLVEKGEKPLKRGRTVSEPYIIDQGV